MKKNSHIVKLSQVMKESYTKNIFPRALKNNYIVSFD